VLQGQASSTIETLLGIADQLTLYPGALLIPATPLHKTIEPQAIPPGMNEKKEGGNVMLASDSLSPVSAAAKVGLSGTRLLNEGRTPIVRLPRLLQKLEIRREQRW
jgi:hypothetical protein